MEPTESRGLAILSGAAHDWNNELTVILNSATEVLRYTPAEDPGRPYLLDILASSQRLALLASSLLHEFVPAGEHPRGIHSRVLRCDGASPPAIPD